MKKESSLSYILILLSLINIGAIKIWAPVCTKLIEMANGNMTYMKCHYTANITILLAILLIIISIESIIKKSNRPISIIALGTISLLTISDKFGIGMCMNPDMSCNTTKIWIIGTAILTIFIGGYSLYAQKKRSSLI